MSTPAAAPSAPASASKPPSSSPFRPRVTLIACVDDEMGLSRGHTIPWDCPEDRVRFRERTVGGILIMGRGTFKSMVPEGKSWEAAWRGRIPVVVSASFARPGNPERPDWVPFGYTLDAAMEWAIRKGSLEGRDVWICGGERLYREALEGCILEAVELSIVPGVHACTSFLPSIPPRLFAETQREQLETRDLPISVVTYTRHPSPYPLPPSIKYRPTHLQGELAYLQLIHECLLAPKSAAEGSRTGVPTRSLLGRSLTFDLYYGLPLLTTKDMSASFPIILDELKWFLEGDTDARHLRSRIWEGNTSESFLRERGLPYEPGVAGPIYGWQWRRSGAPYGIEEGEEGKGGEGVDQIARLLDGLKRNPLSRQHVVCAWNPTDIPRMALPPCHFAFQVVAKRAPSPVVENRDEITLSMVVYQRSADLALGIPFNLASYGILLELIILKLDEDPVFEDVFFKRGTLTIHMGDAHIYEPHEEKMWEQVSRAPFRQPYLGVRGTADLTRLLEPSFDPSWFELIAYDRHGPLKMKMVV